MKDNDNEIVNKYARLRLLVPEDEAPTSYSPAITKTITTDRREMVQIFLQQFGDMWSFGYCVRWANGRCSKSSPGAENGFFANADDATLYAIGFMLMHKRHFTYDTQFALTHAESELSFRPMF